MFSPVSSPKLNSKRVMIVENQAAIRELLAYVLSLSESYDVVAQTGDGQTACQVCMELKPDLVILDIMLPGLHGIEVVRRFSRDSPNTRVLVFSGYHNPELLREILQAGAQGFVEKTAPLSELKAAIEAVSRGESYFTTAMTNLLRNAIAHPSGDPGFSSLTAREREILKLIAESNSTRVIAQRLGISIKTADNHRTNLMRKLNLHDVASLTRYAIEHQLIHPQTLHTIEALSVMNN
jgi:DNA-binding NarL/FixJ family response regulator